MASQTIAEDMRCLCVDARPSEPQPNEAVGEDETQDLNGTADFKVICCVLEPMTLKSRFGLILMGFASNKPAAEFCKARGLPQPFRFDIDLLGPYRATIMAHEWCTKMQYFYDFTVMNGADYRFTARERHSYVFGDMFMHMAAVAATVSVAAFGSRALARKCHQRFAWLISLSPR